MTGIQDVTTTIDLKLKEGIRNLLFNCAGCEPNQKILLVHEAEDDGYYDPDLVGAIAQTAIECGLIPQSHQVPLIRDASDPDPVLATKMGTADCTVFLARLGDQIRFRTKAAAKTQIINYALDRDMLASPFGTLDYRAFEALSNLINRTLATAQDIHVTCPAGTDFRGSPSVFDAAHGDVTRKRFPISVFAPVPASGFSGCVAQRGFLTGTCSNFYSPWSCAIDETLIVNFDHNQITRFDGTAKDVAAAEAHYERVGTKYGLDTYYVHSWHAGIHPSCEYKSTAGQHMERWCGSAFGNPRILHLHTCGNYPPGEISLNVLDPTVSIDGVKVWDNGMLHPARIDGGAALLAANPDMATAFLHPATQVGQAKCGNLRLT